MQFSVSLLTLNEWPNCEQLSLHEMALTFIKTGYILSYFVPIIEAWARNGNQICEVEKNKNEVQRIFEMIQAGAGYGHNRFIFCERGEVQKALCSAGFLLLCVQTIEGGASSKYSFVQYVERTEFNDGAVKLLKCGCLQWSKDDGSLHSKSGAYRARKWKQKKLGEWFEMQLITGI